MQPACTACRVQAVGGRRTPHLRFSSPSPAVVARGEGRPQGMLVMHSTAQLISALPAHGSMESPDRLQIH